jgi:hypothetical protein
MAVQTVLVTVSSIGTNAGPFTISDNVLGILVTGVSAAQLLAGILVNSDVTATSILVVSDAPCNTSLSIPIIFPTPTPTPTRTPTPTPTPTRTPTPTPTSTPNPTPTRTPTPTPTRTPTPTPTFVCARSCKLYNWNTLTAPFVGPLATLNYVNCNGVLTTILVNSGQKGTICVESPNVPYFTSVFGGVIINTDTPCCY